MCTEFNWFEQVYMKSIRNNESKDDADQFILNWSMYTELRPYMI